MEDSIGALVPIVFLALVFGSFIVGRMLKHRERMAMLRMGIIPPRDLRRWNKRGGPGYYGVPPQGMPFTPNMSMNQPIPNYDDPDSPQCTLRSGIKVTMVGIALLIGLSFIGYRPDEVPPIHPGPWLLGGLIPTFVGVAQVIIALISGATFGPLRMQAPPVPPPSYPPPPPPPQPGRPFSGFSEPGQPGPRYEELARPVPPPDRT